MKARFRVQHSVLSGLKYVTAVKRKGIRVAKDQEMLVGFTRSGNALGEKTSDSVHQGSYAPNTSENLFYEKKCRFSLCFSCGFPD